MPIYEYECDACRRRFEVIQKFSQKPLKKCTQCGGPLHRVLSPPALVFKGTGWYVTDYAKPDRAKAEKADGDSKSNGTKSNGAKPSETATPKADSSTKSADD